MVSFDCAINDGDNGIAQLVSWKVYWSFSFSFEPFPNIDNGGAKMPNDNSLQSIMLHDRFNSLS